MIEKKKGSGKGSETTECYTDKTVVMLSKEFHRLFCMVFFTIASVSHARVMKPTYSLSDLIKRPELKDKAMAGFNGTLVYDYWLIANSSLMVPGREGKDNVGWVDRKALGQVVGAPKCTAFASNYSVLHLRLGDAFTTNKSKALWNMTVIPINELAAVLPDNIPYLVVSGIHNAAYKGREKAHIEETKKYLQDILHLLPRGSKVQYRHHSPEYVDEDFCTFVHARVFFMSIGGYSERAAEARCQLRRVTLRVVPNGAGYRLQKYNCTAQQYRH